MLEHVKKHLKNRRHFRLLGYATKFFALGYVCNITIIYYFMRSTTNVKEVSKIVALLIKIMM